MQSIRCTALCFSKKYAVDFDSARAGRLAILTSSRLRHWERVGLEDLFSNESGATRQTMHEKTPWAAEAESYFEQRLA